MVERIGAADLERWADSYEARALLPVLLRRLVHETGARGLQAVDFPGDASVDQPGWDGVVDATRGNAWLPIGRSLWELGTGKDYVGKATGDYEKRSKEPLGSTPQDCCYVAVTPRRWAAKTPDKQTWIETHSGVWADVRAYDASDLAQWLEVAPLTTAWLARQLNKPISGIASPTEYLKSWTRLTDPPMPPELLRAGRTKQVDALKAWLLAEPSTFVVRAHTKEEVVAFALAVLSDLPGGEKAALQDRCAVVDSVLSLEHLLASSAPLVIISLADDSHTFLSAKKHHVLVAADQATNARVASIELGLLSEHLLSRELRERMGFTAGRAEKLSAECGGSITVLRRRLSAELSGGRVPWCEPANAVELVPLLLGGSWHEDHEADKAAIVRLATQEYGEVAGIVGKWTYSSDPPLVRKGDVISWVSRFDAWTLLARFIQRHHLDSFESVALDVLQEANPRFELPPNERWLANVNGKVPQYSEQLRQAVSETLVLLAVARESDQIGDSQRSGDRAAYVAMRVLADRGWVAWASLDDVLPNVAEAGPDVFLEIVDRELAAGDKLIELFKEEPGGISPHSNHCGLLWALERLAWNQAFLSRVALVLGRLAERDPGGGLSNRPDASLRSIFSSWAPQTAAGGEARLATLRMLARKCPSVAWRLVLDLLPEMYSSSIPTSRPLFATWADGYGEGPGRHEQLKYIEGLAALATDTVGIDPVRWSELVGCLHRIPQQHRGVLIETLAQLATSGGIEDPTGVWNALRKVLHDHNAFRGSDWALPEDDVARLTPIYKALEPAEPEQRFGWLFDWQADVPDPPPNDPMAAEQMAAERRVRAVKLLLKTRSPAFFVGLSCTVAESQLLGATLGELCPPPDFEHELVELALARSESECAAFLHSFVLARFAQGGWEWGDDLLRDRTEADHVRLATMLPFNHDTWDRIHQASDAAAEKYWRSVIPRPLVGHPGDCEGAVRGLLSANRSLSAIGVVRRCIDPGTHETRLPPQLVAEVLKEAIEASPEDDVVNVRYSDYELMQLIRVVTGSSLPRALKARIEWLYLGVLRHSGYPLDTLSSELESNPTFFAEIVSWAYKPDSSSGEEVATENEISRGTQSYHLLNQWKGVAGVARGEVNAEKLASWVQTARQECANSGRISAGDYEIGRMLARSPRQENQWPADAVAELIEEYESSDLEEGIRIELYNSRGTIVRRRHAGGEQERDLADQYKQWAVKLPGSPRTAALLQRMSQRYLSEGRREDVRDLER